MESNDNHSIMAKLGSDGIELTACVDWKNCQLSPECPSLCNHFTIKKI